MMVCGLTLKTSICLPLIDMMSAGLWWQEPRGTGLMIWAI